MKAGLQLRISQNLALTPQLQHAIRLLQASTQELQQEVEQMLAENPFLELADDGGPPDTAPESGLDADGVTDAGEHDADPLHDTASQLMDASGQDDWQEAGAWDDWSSGANARDETPEHGDSSLAVEDQLHALPASWQSAGSAAGDDEQLLYNKRQPESLSAHLHQQAMALRLDALDRAALYALIESLNEDGYLEDSLETLTMALQEQIPDSLLDTAHETLQDHLRIALGLLQSMEPTGVGARQLAECLRLQLLALPASQADAGTRQIALDLCAQPLELLARRDLRTLARQTGHSQPALRQALQLIARLEPKPGRRFAVAEQQVVIPDVLVLRAPAHQPQRWLVRLNPAVLPRVQVQDMYAGVLRQHQGEAVQALQQQLQEARWMVKSIQQRFDTILRVSQAIVARQERFFEQGVLAMEPLVMRDIAEALGLHESTISRVSSAKYMQTPWGTFELKYFFGSGVSTDDGQGTSSTAVRALIGQLIADEDPRKPLSDSRLGELLAERGIQCARRTVAKYREQLKLPPAHLRKSLD